MRLNRRVWKTHNNYTITALCDTHGRIETMKLTVEEVDGYLQIICGAYVYSGLRQDLGTYAVLYFYLYVNQHTYFNNKYAYDPLRYH